MNLPQPTVQIEIADVLGNLLDVLVPRDTLSGLNTFQSAKVARVENGVGVLTLQLPANYDTRMLKLDGRIAVRWNPSGSGALALLHDTIYFIRDVIEAYDNGNYYLEVTAYDANHLLRRAIVAYPVGTTYTQKNGFAGNVLKAMVRENLGALATDTTRSRAAYLAVEADKDDGALVTDAFAYEILLNAMQDIVAQSSAAGTYIAFDIVASSLTSLEFRTFRAQRGIDRRWQQTAGGVLLGPEYGNIGQARRAILRADEITVVYTGGQGEGACRVIGSASDSVRLAESPLNRIERFHNATQYTTQAALNSVAQEKVWEGQPKNSLDASYRPTEGAIYGVHLNWGDLVTVSFRNETFHCHISSATLMVDQAISVELKLRNESSFVPAPARDSRLIAQIKQLEKTVAALQAREFTTQTLFCDTLGSTSSLMIPSGQQIIVYDTYTINGDITIEGTLAIL